MGLRIVVAVLALVVGALAVVLIDQRGRLELLELELHAIRAKVPGPSTIAAGRSPQTPVYIPPPQRLPAPAPAALPEPGTEDPAQARAAEPRVPVTQAEIAHVESAVLSLLEADRPELREKLRGVVQEQQRTLEQQQREERRERWVTRREARLLEVGKDIGLNAEQQQAVLHIMLATRDQVSDMRQSAQTPEAINGVREQARAVREQSEAQIRELMSTKQYESFSERFRDDDDDERRGPRREP
jgi:hypothetical protein